MTEKERGEEIRTVEWCSSMRMTSAEGGLGLKPPASRDAPSLTGAPCGS